MTGFYLKLCSIILIFSGVLSDEENINLSYSNSPFECGTDPLVKKFSLINQGKINRIERKRLETYRKENLQNRKSSAFVLPVVVHVVHQNGPENIPINQVENAINLLNKAFSNHNIYNTDTGLDTDIQFCLSKRTPNNTSTIGINKILSPLTNLNYIQEDLKLKNLSRWNPENYINIWVVNEICANTSCGVAGYAYLPYSHGSKGDGIVIEAKYFGSSPTNNTVLVHEMGHYLGLYHTFEGGCYNDDCLTDGDLVCDTPPDNTTAPTPCDNPPNSCTTDTQSGLPTDLNDMTNNYMDYSDLSCFNAFTTGQVVRMKYFIESVRASLLNSSACVNPCPAPVSAIVNISDTTIFAGESLTFTQSSLNDNNIVWKINDQDYSTNSSFTFLFDNTGSYRITLIAESNNQNCFSDSVTVVVSVNCPTTSDFELSSYTLVPDQVISISNSSISANEFQWSLNGMPVSTTANYTFQESATGIYEICLVAKGLYCENEKCIFIEVENKNNTCESSIIKEFGTEDFDEGALNITPAPDGNLIIGGYKNDSTIIMNISPKGEINWQRSYKFTTARPDKLVNFFIDSEGYLIGCGWGRAGDNASTHGFIFKLDLQSQNIVWAKESINDHGLFFFGCQESPSGTYLVAGEEYRSSCKAIWLEFDRNTGDITNLDHSYTIGTCEDFYHFEIYNNSIYSAGRFNNSNGNNRMRGALAHFDLSGNLRWARQYLINLNLDARLYCRDFVIENDSIYALHFGSKNSGSLFNSSFYLVASDINGKTNWAKEFSLAGSSLYAWNITSTNTGFIILCINNNDNSLILLYTNKSGELIWSKKLTNKKYKYNHGTNLINIGNNIYFTAIAESGGDENIFFLKLNTTETNFENYCQYLEPVNILMSDFPNPYDGLVNLVKSTENSILTDRVQTNQTPALTSESLCLQPCLEDCSNNTDDDGDGRIDCLDEDCKCLGNCTADLIIASPDHICTLDSMQFDLQICNQGAIAFPPQTPYAVYDGNPFATAASRLFAGILAHRVGPDSCITIRQAFPFVVEELFIVVNDDGSRTTPFDNEDLAVSPGFECDYSNNWTKITFTKALYPSVNLGPDQLMCSNGIFTLKAEGTYANYRWQNGATDSTFTGDEPGKYWVCVSNECGTQACDTVEVFLDTNTVIDLGPELAICMGDSIFLEDLSNKYQKYQWFPATRISCDTCQFAYVQPLEDTWYQLIGQSPDGCVGTDSIFIKVHPTYTFIDSIFFCSGDSVELAGDFYKNPGTYQFSYQSSNTCDSIRAYELILATDTTNVFNSLEICEGDSIILFGNVVTESGTYSGAINSGSCKIIEHITVTKLRHSESSERLNLCKGQKTNFFGQELYNTGSYEHLLQNAIGCDSVITLYLEMKDTFLTVEDLNICQGERADIFGGVVSTPGIYERLYATEFGCDSIHRILLTVHDTFFNQDDLLLCPGDSLLVFDEYVSESGFYKKRFNSVYGCDSTQSISVRPQPEMGMQALSTPACFGEADGSLRLEHSSGTQAQTVRWEDGSTGFNRYNLNEGLYRYTLTDDAGCQKIDSARVAERPPLHLTSTAEDVRCGGQIPGIIEINNPENYTVILNGNPIQSHARIDNLESGVYQLTVRDSFNCRFDTSLFIDFQPAVLLTLPQDTTINLGNSVFIAAVTNRPVSTYSWKPPTGIDCIDCKNVIAGPVQTTTYQLTVTDSTGCSTSDEIEIRILIQSNVYIPGAFSPNDDGINDFFTIFGGPDVRIIRTLKIFDRWGEFIWEGSDLKPNDPSTGWDGSFRGRPLNSGIFVFFTEIEFLDGRTEIYKGDITLMK